MRSFTINAQFLIKNGGNLFLLGAIHRKVGIFCNGYHQKITLGAFQFSWHPVKITKFHNLDDKCLSERL